MLYSSEIFRSWYRSAEVMHGESGICASSPLLTAICARASQETAAPSIENIVIMAASVITVRSKAAPRVPATQRRTKHNMIAPNRRHSTQRYSGLPVPAHDATDDP